MEWSVLEEGTSGDRLVQHPDKADCTRSHSGGHSVYAEEMGQPRWTATRVLLSPSK